MKNPSWLKVIYFIVGAEVAGMIGSLFTFSEIPTWYATLTKPMLNPPSWIFGPVWTTLYALMGISAFLVWQKFENAKNKKQKKTIKFALEIFSVQLLNILWSIIFFGLHNPALAFLEIAFMWVAIVATIKVFWAISKPAAYLLVPYILWVTFASYLNFSIWQLNKTTLQERSGICTEEAMMCPDGTYVGRTGPQCEFAKCL
jgi:benzodiazapine receptor